LHNEFKKIRGEVYDMLHSAKLGEFNQQLEENLYFLKR